jgi:hypothetical protein
MAAEAARFAINNSVCSQILATKAFAHEWGDGFVAFFLRECCARAGHKNINPDGLLALGQGRRWTRKSITIVVGEEADSGKSIDASSPQGSPSGSRGCFSIDHTTAPSLRQRDPLGVSGYQFPRSIVNCIESDIYFQKGQRT